MSSAPFDIKLKTFQERETTRKHLFNYRTETHIHMT